MTRFSGSERRRLHELVVRLRRDGLGYAEIGARIGLTASAARYLALWDPPERRRVFSAMVPETVGAKIWNWPPIKPGGGRMYHNICELCELEPECRSRILEWGQWMIGCERPLRRELKRNHRYAYG